MDRRSFVLSVCGLAATAVMPVRADTPYWRRLVSRQVGRGSAGRLRFRIPPAMAPVSRLRIHVRGGGLWIDGFGVSDRTGTSIWHNTNRRILPGWRTAELAIPPPLARARTITVAIAHLPLAGAGPVVEVEALPAPS